MRKYITLLIIISILLFLVLLIPKAHASLFGIDPTLFKNEMNTTHNEISAIKAQIGTMQNTLSIQMKAQAQAQADLTAGVNNSVKAGRDTNSTESTINDTRLMKYLIGIMGGIIALLINQIFRLFNKFLQSTIESKEAYKQAIFQKTGIQYKPACEKPSKK